MDAANPKPEPIDDAPSVNAPSRLYDRYRAIQDDPEREMRWATWREEHAGAIAAWNDYYEKHGHPLAAYMIKPGDLLPR